MNEKEEILITANKYMERLIPAIELLSDMFINGNKHAMNDLMDLIEGIDYITKVLDLVEIEPNIIEMLNEYLSEIINAIQNNDYILVGDLMKYELIPVLLKVSGMLSV